MSQYIEYIGGPYDGLITEWFKIPPPVAERHHRGIDYRYRLHDIERDDDVELVYYFVGFHGRPICPEPTVGDEA